MAYIYKELLEKALKALEDSAESNVITVPRGVEIQQNYNCRSTHIGIDYAFGESPNKPPFPERLTLDEIRRLFRGKESR